MTLIQKFIRTTFAVAAFALPTVASASWTAIDRVDDFTDEKEQFVVWEDESHRLQINGCADVPARKGPLWHFQPITPIHHRLKITAQAPGPGPIPPPHFQHVAQPCSTDHTRLCALTLQQRVRPRGRPMHHNTDF